MKKITRQNLSYVIGPYREEAIRVAPGEKFLIETEDAYSGAYKSEADATPEKLRLSGMGFSNPVSGPVYIEGCKPGDALCVRVHEINCLNPGKTRMRPGAGVIGDFVNGPTVRFMHIADGCAVLPGGYRVALAPMIGTIGVSPRLEALATTVPGAHGGNLDFRDIGPGSELMLPVYVDGALLYMGDVHATQGDGEFAGAAVEVAAEVVASCLVLSPAPPYLRGPLLRRGTSISALWSDKPLDSAVKESVSIMVNWLSAEYGLTKEQAYLLLTNTGFSRVCQMVNPIYTAACTINTEHIRS